MGAVVVVVVIIVAAVVVVVVVAVVVAIRQNQPRRDDSYTNAFLLRSHTHKHFSRPLPLLSKTSRPSRNAEAIGKQYIALLFENLLLYVLHQHNN